MKNDLLKLGLSWNEVKVYECLVSIGETPVGGVIKELKVHRQIAYNALNNLIKRGMVEKIIKNRIAHYRISDPSVIVDNIKQQEVLAERIVEKVKKEMKKSPHENIIKIHEGVNQIRKVFLDNLKELPIKSEYFVLSGLGERFVRVVGEEFLANKYEKTREKRGIKIKVLYSEIFRSEEKEVARVLKTKDTKREHRFLPYNLPSPVTTVIWKDSIGYQFFLEKPFIMEIKNQQLRDSYAENFKLLWNIAIK